MLTDSSQVAGQPRPRLSAGRCDRGKEGAVTVTWSGVWAPGQRKQVAESEDNQGVAACW